MYHKLFAGTPLLCCYTVVDEDHFLNTFSMTSQNGPGCCSFVALHYSSLDSLPPS